MKIRLARLRSTDNLLLVLSTRLLQNVLFAVNAQLCLPRYLLGTYLPRRFTLLPTWLEVVFHQTFASSVPARLPGQHASLARFLSSVFILYSFSRCPPTLNESVNHPRHIYLL